MFCSLKLSLHWGSFFVVIKLIMALKKNITHPAFIIGAASFVLFLLGIVLEANNYVYGDKIILSAIALGALHWIWSMTDVLTGFDLNPDSKSFWLIIVMLIPPMGGMIYYMMKRKNVSM